jgi:hypothetical protein
LEGWQSDKARGTSLQSLRPLNSASEDAGSSHGVGSPFRVFCALGNPLLKHAASVAGRLVFPAPSLTFQTVAGLGPPRYSRCFLPFLDLDRRTSTLLGFRLPFRALGGSPAPTLACASSLEIRSKIAPPPRSAVCPLPGASSLRPVGTTAWSRSAFVVSHHHDGFLHTSVCELVASHSRSGVHRVVTHDAFRTLRSLSLVRSRTASLQPLPSCRSTNTSLPEASFGS